MEGHLTPRWVEIIRQKYGQIAPFDMYPEMMDISGA